MANRKWSRLIELWMCATLSACATAAPPNSALIQAKSIYGSLEQRGAERRIDADMERAKAAIDRADSSAIETQGLDYVSAVSDIALHLAQAAEEKMSALGARQAADSLSAARLARLLSLSEAQRAQLLSQNQVTAAEMEALRQRNVTMTERVDSLRTESAAEHVRGDSLRQVAESAQRQADSVAAVAAGASRELTVEERERSDSLRRVASTATMLADSLRGIVQYSARARDSVRIAQSAGEVERSLADSLVRDNARIARAADSARTATERARADSYRATAERAAAQLDSARRESERSGHERDSLRLAITGATRQADSLSEAVAAAARARDSLRLLNEQLASLQRTTRGLRTVTMTDRGLVISMSGVLFDPGASVLKAGGVRNVRRIAQVLEQYPNYRISVEGHTDSTGSAERNQTLSEARAAAVMQALSAGGVDPARISTKGMGATQPVATNNTAAGRQQNRRVEIVVMGASMAVP